MRKLRNFKCSETGETIERLVNDNILIVECNCKGLAHRALSSGRYLGNSTGRSPSLSNRKN